MNFEEIWNTIVAFFEARGWSIVIFLAVFVAGVIIVRAVCYWLSRLLLKSKVEKTLVGFIITVLRFVLYLVLVFILAGVIGIDMTPIASALSAAVVAIGLALQSSLSNIANGVVLISTRPFKEGDYVDIGSVSGTVQSVGMFVTVLITPDNKKVVLTNTNVLANNVVNYSERPTRRVDMVFSVSYSEDVERAKSIISRVVEAHPLVLDEPAPTVRLHEFKDSSIGIITRPWVNNADYWTVYWDLNEQIYAELNKEGIQRPFNQLDVHVKKEEQ